MGQSHARVTPYWTVKVTDYALNDVLRELVGKNMVSIDVVDVNGESVQGLYLLFCPPIFVTDLLHIAPELTVHNKTVFSASFAGDVYALGALRYQTENRLPLIDKDQLLLHPTIVLRANGAIGTKSIAAHFKTLYFFGPTQNLPITALR